MVKKYAKHCVGVPISTVLVGVVYFLLRAGWALADKQVCMFIYICKYIFMYRVSTFSRVWINRAWLPILLEVSSRGKMNVSRVPVRA